MRWLPALAAVAALFLAAAWGYDWVTSSLASAPRPAAVDLYDILIDRSPLTVQTSNDRPRGLHASTVDAVLTSVPLWRRMTLADWNLVPEPVRRRGLDNMLSRYGPILCSPRAWDRMTAADWDDVPQPVRTLAYRQMVDYWAGYLRSRRHLRPAPRARGRYARGDRHVGIVVQPPRAVRQP